VAFKPATLYRMCRSKANLFRGVDIRWWCDPSLPRPQDVPQEERFHFPGGLGDFLAATLEGRAQVTPEPFVGTVEVDDHSRVAWAIAWPEDDEGFCNCHCKTIPTPEGGTHEAGLRAALTRGLKSYGELVQNRRAGQVTGEDVMHGAAVM